MLLDEKGKAWGGQCVLGWGGWHGGGHCPPLPWGAIYSWMGGMPTQLIGRGGHAMQVRMEPGPTEPVCVYRLSSAQPSVCRSEMVQAMPCISVAEGQISAVRLNQDLIHCGHRLNFDINNEAAEVALEHKLYSLLILTNQLKIRTETQIENCVTIHTLSNVVWNKLYDVVDLRRTVAWPAVL